LTRRFRGSRERLFNAGVPGNQPDFLLVDLDADLACEFPKHRPAARRAVSLMVSARRRTRPRYSSAIPGTSRVKAASFGGSA
jgi:hypothetical protein